MPRLEGQNTDANTIADRLRVIGDGMYRPVDAVSREKILRMQRQDVSRANAAAALQRGDTQEYLTQSILADQPAADALGYARQSGMVGPDGTFVRPAGNPVLPSFSPAAQPVSMALPNTMAPASNSGLPRFSPAPPSGAGGSGGTIAMPGGGTPWS